ncbi:MAG: prepilin-type N-terminal cleavage/methylation domain-containing protein [Pontixanthobacter sp.]
MGGISTRCDTPPTTQSAGLTLVEMLVVLAIIAVTASVSVLALGGDRNFRGLAEARQIEARLQLAADQTMIDGLPRAISVTARDYRFLQFDLASGGWLPIVDRTLAEPFELPGGMGLRSEPNAALYPLGADGSGQPFVLHLDEGERRWSIAFDGVTARMTQQQALGANAP